MSDKKGTPGFIAAHLVFEEHSPAQVEPSGDAMNGVQLDSMLGRSRPARRQDDRKDEPYIGIFPPKARRASIAFTRSCANTTPPRAVCSICIAAHPKAITQDVQPDCSEGRTCSQTGVESNAATEPMERPSAASKASFFFLFYPHIFREQPHIPCESESQEPPQIA